MGKLVHRLPEKLMAARFQSVRNWPYLSSALWNLIPVEVSPEELHGMSTLGVDQYWRLYFDPAAVARWNVAELAGVLYHEIMHLLRDHAARGTAKLAYPRVWNIAGDCEINDDLVTEKVTLPKTVVTPGTFQFPDGELVESYYDRLMKNAKFVQLSMVGPRGEGSPGDGNPEGGSGKGSGTPGQPGGPAGGHCGSCADGEQQPWELGEPGEGNPGIGSGEAEIIRARIAKDIEDHAKSRGTVPAHLQRWAGQKLAPQVDWRAVIRGMVRRAVRDEVGMVDYSYARPSRRQGMGTGVVMPSLRQPKPNMAVAIDTSGSMGNEELAQALAEVGGVMRKLGIRDGLPVFSVDAHVHNCKSVFRPEQVTLVGGGGTDMGVGIATAYQMRPRPSVCIVLTDGYTPWPAVPTRGMNVVAAIIGNREPKEWKVPSWIRSVYIPLSAFAEPGG